MGYELEWYMGDGVTQTCYCKINNIIITKEIGNFNFGCRNSGNYPVTDVFYAHGNYTIYDRKGGNIVSIGEINVDIDIDEPVAIMKHMYQKMKELIEEFKNSKEV